VSTEVDRVVVYKKTALVNHLKAPRLSGCVCSAKAKSVYEMWMSSIIKLELSLEIQGHLYGYAQAACDRPAVRRGIKRLLYCTSSNRMDTYKNRLSCRVVGFLFWVFILSLLCRHQHLSVSSLKFILGTV
jgi:hypothetical protein